MVLRPVRQKRWLETSGPHSTCLRGSCVPLPGVRQPARLSLAAHFLQASHMVSVSDVVTERCACPPYLSAGRKSVVQSLSMQAHCHPGQAGCTGNTQQMSSAATQTVKARQTGCASGQQAAKKCVCCTSCMLGHHVVKAQCWCFSCQVGGWPVACRRVRPFWAAP